MFMILIQTFKKKYNKNKIMQSQSLVFLLMEKIKLKIPSYYYYHDCLIILLTYCIKNSHEKH